jgi:hypothetical protein
MTRLILTYLAGALTVVAAVLFADRMALIAFGLGVGVALAAAVALLSSVRRLHKAAGLLTTVAEVIERRQSPVTATAGPQLVPAPTAEADLTSALRNLGASSGHARATARAVLAEYPRASFDMQLKHAISRTTRRTA